ncbi:MAG: protein-L-isoaspartate(D-aspartate) O-methyltransferase [Hyphomicrobiaceae bacterium]
MSDTKFAAHRQTMVTLIAAKAGLCAARIGKETLSERVLEAMNRVPRHRFVPTELEELAYEDMPLPIGCDKTISQPFIVALMTDLLDLKEDDKVLEIGTGLGYQAAVLAELCREVFSVEILHELAREAERRLTAAGRGNIRLRNGDGARGWREHAPFDKIILTAAPELVPPALVEQLKPGGRMVLPAGSEDDQRLIVVEKSEDCRTRTKDVLPVRFSVLIASH